MSSNGQVPAVVSPVRNVVWLAILDIIAFVSGVVLILTNHTVPDWIPGIVLTVTGAIAGISVPGRV